MAYDYSKFLENHEKRIEKERLNRASYMNTSKWEKLFLAVHESNISLHGESVKFLLSEHITPFNLKKDGLSYVRAYTCDTQGGPVHYKEIEWIFVPASHNVQAMNQAEKLQPKFNENDIYALKILIDGLGLYEYDFNEDGLKIYGYK